MIMMVRRRSTWFTNTKQNKTRGHFSYDKAKCYTANTTITIRAVNISIVLFVKKLVLHIIDFSGLAQPISS